MIAKLTIIDAREVYFKEWESQVVTQFVVAAVPQSGQDARARQFKGEARELGILAWNEHQISTVLQQGQKSLTGDSCCSDQILNDVDSDFAIARDNERAGCARLFKFDVTPFLSSRPVSESPEYTNNLLPF